MALAIGFSMLGCFKLWKINFSLMFILKLKRIWLYDLIYSKFASE